MIEITLRTLVAASEALRRLCDIPLPLPIAYSISRLVAEIDPHLKRFELKRAALSREYGVGEGPGNGASRVQFEAAVTRLLNEVLTIDRDKPQIPLDPTIRLSAATLYALCDVIDFVKHDVR